MGLAEPPPPRPALPPAPDDRGTARPRARETCARLPCRRPLRDRSCLSCPREECRRSVPFAAPRRGRRLRRRWREEGAREATQATESVVGSEGYTRLVIR